MTITFQHHSANAAVRMTWYKSIIDTLYASNIFLYVKMLITTSHNWPDNNVVECTLRILSRFHSPLYYIFHIKHSLLWCCWLGGKKSMQPVKTEWWGDGMVVCLEHGTDLYIWPSWCHCHSLSLASVKCRLVFTFLVPAYPGSSGKRAIKRVYVCMYVTYSLVLLKSIAVSNSKKL